MYLEPPVFCGVCEASTPTDPVTLTRHQRLTPTLQATEKCVVVHEKPCPQPPEVLPTLVHFLLSDERWMINVQSNDWCCSSHEM
jgi:hypothetical protein